MVPLLVSYPQAHFPSFVLIIEVTTPKHESVTETKERDLLSLHLGPTTLAPRLTFYPVLGGKCPQGKGFLFVVIMALSQSPESAWGLCDVLNERANERVFTSPTSLCTAAPPGPHGGGQCAGLKTLRWEQCQAGKGWAPGPSLDLAAWGCAQGCWGLEECRTSGWQGLEPRILPVPSQLSPTCQMGWRETIPWPQGEAAAAHGVISHQTRGAQIHPYNDPVRFTSLFPLFRQGNGFAEGAQAVTRGRNSALCDTKAPLDPNLPRTGSRAQCPPQPHLCTQLMLSR